MTVLPLPVSPAPAPYRAGRDAGSGRHDGSTRGGDFASALAAAGSADRSRPADVKPAKATHGEPVEYMVASSETAVADQAATDQAATGQAAADQATTGQAAADQATTGQAAADQADGGKAVETEPGDGVPNDLAAAVPADLVVLPLVPGAVPTQVLTATTAFGTPAAAAIPGVPAGVEPGVSGDPLPGTTATGASIAAGVPATQGVEAAATGSASGGPGTPVLAPGAAAVAARTADAVVPGADAGLSVSIPAATSSAVETGADPAAISSGPSASTTAPPVAGVPAAPAGVPTAPPAPVVAAQPVSTPMPADPVAIADQVLTTVTPLRRGPDGTHVLTMRLDPGHLGPLTVVAEVRDGAIRLELTAAMPAVQKALEQAAGDLRRDLADAGFSGASVDVRSGGPGDRRAGDGTDSRTTQGSAPDADAGVGPAYESRGDRTADHHAVRYGPGGHRAVDVRV